MVSTHRWRSPKGVTLTLRVHRGAEPWAPPPSVLARLSGLLSVDVTVELVPRSQLAAQWAADHGGRSLPAIPPYAFRAYSRNRRASLFVDSTETPGSTLWLLLHELAHLSVGEAPLLREAYRSLPRPADYLTSDEAHESHPEEQLANLVATQTLAALGLPAVSLDRRWWRERVRG